MYTYALNYQPRLLSMCRLFAGVHWDTQVKPPKTHRVAQVYASAVPVAYAKSTTVTDWEAFARMVLEAAYDATLLVAKAMSQRQGGRRVTVYLTQLGGGAFGNPKAWILDAIKAALRKHQHAPLDVKLVHYCSVPPSAVTDLSFPERGPTKRHKGTRASEASCTTF